MATLKYKQIKKDNDLFTLQRFYKNKYFALFMNAYKFDGVDDQQARYILKKFWQDGKILAFKIDGTENEENPNGVICFTGFTYSALNIYDYPTNVLATNTRGASFIPATPMQNMVNCVVGYGHTSHESIEKFVNRYIDLLAEIDNTIEINLFTHKLPRLIVCSPTDRQRVNDLIRAIENGEKKLFLDTDDFNAIKNVLSAGDSGYIIDKLYMFKQNVENELLTFLGIDNVGIDKRERLITDEANANNDVINDNSNCFLTELQTFCKNIKDVLNYDISVTSTSAVVTSLREAPKNDDMDNGGIDNDNI